MFSYTYMALKEEQVPLNDRVSLNNTIAVQRGQRNGILLTTLEPIFRVRKFIIGEPARRIASCYIYVTTHWMAPKVQKALRVHDDDCPVIVAIVRPSAVSFLYNAKNSR